MRQQLTAYFRLEMNFVNKGCIFNIFQDSRQGQLLETFPSSSRHAQNIDYEGNAITQLHLFDEHVQGRLLEHMYLIVFVTNSGITLTSAGSVIGIRIG